MVNFCGNLDNFGVDHLNKKHQKSKENSKGIISDEEANRIVAIQNNSSAEEDELNNRVKSMMGKSDHQTPKKSINTNITNDRQ